MQKLEKLKANEVSLVPQGANRRRFMVFKSAPKMSTQEELQKAIASTDQETMKRVGAVLDKHITNDPEGNGVVRTVMQAMSRIASTVKGKISPQAMHDCVDAVGFQLTDDASGNGEGLSGGAGANSVGESPSHGETENMAGKMKMVPKEDLEKAADCAQKAYDEHMNKLGYPKYPDAQIQMKSKSGPAVSKEMDDEDDGEDVEKGANMKIDAEKMAKVDAIFKAFEDVTKENKDLKTEVAALQLVNKQRELVQVAKSFVGLSIPQDMIVQTLIDAEKVGKESFDRVVKQYEMMAEQTRVAKSFGGDLFSEKGSSLPGGGGHGSESAWAKIEKAAAAVVQKSDGKITTAQGIADYLSTPEGVRLYAEHQAGRKDGI